MKLKSIFSFGLSMLVAGSLVLSATSCSSIFNGSYQNVDIKAREDGAEVFINGNMMAKTPASVRLQRGKDHIIEIKKSGYDTYRITTGKSITGWFWGNLLCGGLVGMVIDLATGNAYDVEPSTIMASMTKSTALLGNYNSDDFSYIYLKDRTGKIVDSFVIEWQ